MQSQGIWLDKSRSRKKLRVLHLPHNIASQISVSVRALRDIGVDARGLVLNNSPIQQCVGVETHRRHPRRKNPIRGTIGTIQWWHAVLSAIRWADVVHWHFTGGVLPRDVDLKYIASLRKRRIVEFWGSDIRIDEIAASDNPYFEKLLGDPNYKGNHSFLRSRALQEKFARLGFECLIPGPELKAYVQTDLFPPIISTRQRLILAEFEPHFPDPDRDRPLIVHSPSNPARKGTDVVLSAIDTLQKKHSFDFKLVHQVSHDEALHWLQDCDIMLDQFVIGDHGLAALEAMALGKPTLCYIKPAVASQLPADCPIVNANQDNLVEILDRLLLDGRLRHEIGQQSRFYVEKYHDAHQIAAQLETIYREAISKA